MAELTITGLRPSLEAAVRSRLTGAELDVAVVGADELPTGAFLAIEQSEWEAAVSGVGAAFRAAQAEAARLVAAGRPGRVVFLVATASLRVLHGAALPATAGGFLTTIAQVGAVELGGSGVTVNVVAHGWLDDAPAALVDGVPVGRLARPEDVAAAVAFLASAEAAYVNGAVLAVDGGFWITKSGGGSPLLA